MLKLGSRLLGLTMVMQFAFGGTARAQERQWNPSRCWVFAVSTTVFKNDQSLQMPKKGREDTALIDALKGAGVPESQIVFLKDEQSSHDNIVRSFAQMLEKSRPGDSLLFYFQGHGSRDIADGKSAYYFVDYDADPKADKDYFFMDEVFKLVGQHFHGSSAVLTADCCSSGGLATLAARKSWTLPTLCLTSVNAHNESSGSWTYTDSLIRGLKGDPRADLNHDGQITFSELGQYIQQEMAFLEKQRSVFAVFNGYSPDQKMATVQGTLDPALGRHVTVTTDGKTYDGEVIGTRGSEVQVVYPGYEEPEWTAKSGLVPFKAKALAIGTEVSTKSESDEKVHPGTVLKTYEGLHLVHFTDLDATYDEWIPYERLKTAP